MKKFEKFAKHLSGDFMFLFLIELGIFSIDVLFTPFAFMLTAKIFKLFQIIFLFAGYYLAKKHYYAAGILGVITGVLMVLLGLLSSILTLLLGIFLTIHSIVYLCTYKKQN